MNNAKIENKKTGSLPYSSWFFDRNKKAQTEATDPIKHSRDVKGKTRNTDKKNCKFPEQILQIPIGQEESSHNPSDKE